MAKKTRGLPDQECRNAKRAKTHEESEEETEEEPIVPVPIKTKTVLCCASVLSQYKLCSALNEYTHFGTGSQENMICVKEISKFYTLIGEGLGAMKVDGIRCDEWIPLMYDCLHQGNDAMLLMRILKTYECDDDFVRRWFIMHAADVFSNYHPFNRVSAPSVGCVPFFLIDKETFLGVGKNNEGVDCLMIFHIGKREAYEELSGTFMRSSECNLDPVQIVAAIIVFTTAYALRPKLLSIQHRSMVPYTHREIKMLALESHAFAYIDRKSQAYCPISYRFKSIITYYQRKTGGGFTELMYDALPVLKFTYTKRQDKLERMHGECSALISVMEDCDWKDKLKE